MKKGRMLLKHKCEKLKMELAPSFLLKWNTDRTDVFFAFEFFENGIELNYNNKKKKPLFIEYSRIKRVYFTTKDYFKQYQEIDGFPAWISISAPPRFVSTYPSGELPVDKIRGIFDQKGCKIEKRIVTNDRRIYNYSIREYSFGDDGFEIVFLDGLKKNYSWDNVDSVSGLTADPFRISFYDGESLLFDPMELSFIGDFRKRYDEHLGRF
jgi:hypothetical protein